ncbi:hypothetical protein ADL02_24730 [Streptomyces sp. NRRL WC-3723]|nr:hypothetical protein ADL02_24730 [Streptomyces sp. NRRL WC-3723]
MATFRRLMQLSAVRLSVVSTTRAALSLVRVVHLLPVRELSRVLELLHPLRHQVVDGGHMALFEHPELAAREIVSFHGEVGARITA